MKIKNVMIGVAACLIVMLSGVPSFAWFGMGRESSGDRSNSDAKMEQKRTGDREAAKKAQDGKVWDRKNGRDKIESLMFKKLDLTDEQHSSYKIIEEQSRQRLSQPETKRMHVFTAITRLKQICSYDADSGTSCKLDYLAEELENIIANNQKALVFSHFPQVTLKPISKELQQFSPAIYDGTLTDSQGEKLLKAFQNEPTPRVLLTSIRAGGVGLNLMRASQVFHLDHWWNPAIARQAEARAHRHGQSETVIVHRIFTKGTIEERIYQLLQEKQSLFDMVIDDLTEEQIKGALSLEELFGLFDLEAPTPRDKRPVKKRSGYTPVAPYSALKQVEDKLNRAESIEEVRRVAQLECSRIGYKAFCYLLGELATPEMMKGK